MPLSTLQIEQRNAHLVGCVAQLCVEDREMERRSTMEYFECGFCRCEMDTVIPADIDQDKLAELALAILWLSAHGDAEYIRVWKGVDWDAMNLLVKQR